MAEYERGVQNYSASVLGVCMSGCHLSILGELFICHLSLLWPSGWLFFVCENYSTGLWIPAEFKAILALYFAGAATLFLPSIANRFNVVFSGMATRGLLLLWVSWVYLLVLASPFFAHYTCVSGDVASVGYLTLFWALPTSRMILYCSLLYMLHYIYSLLHGSDSYYFISLLSPCNC